MTEERSQTRLFRLGLFNSIITRKISISGCNLVKLLKDGNVKKKDVKKKDSASDTIIVFGKLRFKILDKRITTILEKLNRDIVVKFSFGTKNDNSLEIERDIYTHIINPLYIHRYTPNVILTLGTFQCDTKEFVRNIQTYWNQNKTTISAEEVFLFKDFDKQLQNLYGENYGHYDTNKLNVLLLERGKGMPFKDWADNSRTVDDWKSILFQIIYTLTVFGLVGLRHNDLHDGNIFIQTPVDTQRYIYRVSEYTYFSVPITYLAKLYDFDLGAVKAVKNITSRDLAVFDKHNTKLDPNNANFCRKYGICNNYNPKFDLFTILNYIYFVHMKNSNDEVKKYLYSFISSAIPDYSLINVEKFGFPFRLCNLKAQGVCDGDWVPPMDKVKMPIDVLFENFPEYIRDGNPSNQNISKDYMYRLFPDL